MMLDGAEEGQFKGPIDVLVPYSFSARLASIPVRGSSTPSSIVSARWWVASASMSTRIARAWSGLATGSTSTIKDTVTRPMPFVRSKTWLWALSVWRRSSSGATGRMSRVQHSPRGSDSSWRGSTAVLRATPARRTSASSSLCDQPPRIRRRRHRRRHASLSSSCARPVNRENEVTAVHWHCRRRS